MVIFLKLFLAIHHRKSEFVLVTEQWVSDFFWWSTEEFYIYKKNYTVLIGRFCIIFLVLIGKFWSLSCNLFEKIGRFSLLIDNFCRFFRQSNDEFNIFYWQLIDNFYNIFPLSNGKIFNFFLQPIGENREFWWEHQHCSHYFLTIFHTLYQFKLPFFFLFLSLLLLPYLLQ